MSESTISNQVNKIITRLDQKLSYSPSYTKSYEQLKKNTMNESKKIEVRPNIQTDSIKTLACLQEIYQNPSHKHVLLYISKEEQEQTNIVENA